jgi:hypothetical protein
MSDISAGPRKKTPAESKTVAVSFRSDLNLTAGEILTGTPTVTVTGLTVSNIAVNSTTITLDPSGEVCTAGQAVVFLVSGGTAGDNYTMRVQCGTNSTPAQVLEIPCVLQVRST